VINVATMPGGAGAANRATLAQGMTEILEQHGFKEGETTYIEQKELWIGADPL